MTNKETHDCENNIESNMAPPHCRICGKTQKPLQEGEVFSKSSAEPASPNPSTLSRIDEMSDEFVSWYFGNDQYWSTHDHTRARLMKKQFTAVVATLLSDIEGKIEAKKITNGDYESTATNLKNEGFNAALDSASEVVRSFRV